MKTVTEKYALNGVLISRVTVYTSEHVPPEESRKDVVDLFKPVLPVGSYGHALVDAVASLSPQHHRRGSPPPSHRRTKDPEPVLKRSVELFKTHGTPTLKENPLRAEDRVIVAPSYSFRVVPESLFQCMVSEMDK